MKNIVIKLKNQHTAYFNWEELKKELVNLKIVLRISLSL